MENKITFYVKDNDPVPILLEMVRMVQDGSMAVESIDYQSVGPGLEAGMAVFKFVVREIHDKDQ